MDWISTAIAGVSQGVNALLQSGQNRKNREFQERENEKARQFAVQQWNAQNEYNLPTNQMTRLRDAGINPHLAYSNGTPMNSSNAPAAPSGVSSLPAGEAPKFNLGELYQTLLTKSQIKNMDADTAKKEAEKREVEARTENTTTDTEIKKVELNHKDREIMAKINVDEQQVEESKSRIESSAVANRKMEQEIENLKSQKNLTDQQVENLKKTIYLIMAQIDNTNADTHLKEAQRQTELVRKGNVEADTRLKNAQVTGQYIQNMFSPMLLSATVSKVYSEIKKIGVDIGHIQHQELSSIIGALSKYVRDGYNTMNMSSLP